MEKKNEFYLIKDVLKNAVNDKNYKENFIIFLLKKKWFDIIGEKLYPYTVPIKIFKNNLYINCSHQGWIQTLQFYKKDILEKISIIYKKDIVFKDIVFILGKVNNDKIENKNIKIYKETDKIFENPIENLELYFKILNQSNDKTNLKG